MKSSSDTTLERYLRQQQQMSGSVLFYDKDELRKPSSSLQAGTEESIDGLAGRNIGSATLQDKAESSLLIAQEEIDDMASDKNWKNARSLPTLRDRICDCQNCALGQTRNKFVFGVGNPQARIVVIGEAPGADEDAQGEPFVGRAGQLLTKILEAVDLQREDVFICNILKCRPPGNRVPTPEEVDQCEPYLYKQLQIIQPAFILALGLTAVNTLLKSKFKMADVRGKFFYYQDVRMMVTYHPAALLRNPEWKKYTWEDVQRLRKAYDEFEQSGALPEFDALPSH